MLPLRHGAAIPAYAVSGLPRETLFDDLPQEYRDELERRYDAIENSRPPGVLQQVIPGWDLSLAGVFEESRNAFPRLRYAFEGAENPSANPLPDAFGLWWFVSVLKPYLEEQDAPQ